jgi:hypothetical protein
MLRSYRSLLFLFAVSLALSACCKKRLYCDSGTLKIAFAGFPRNDVRLIMLKRYKTGDFSKPLDSTTLSYSGNAPVLLNKKDTLWLSDYTSSSPMGNNITWGNDWKIRFIGTTPREYRITSIGDEGRRYQLVKCDDRTTRCTNELSHFSINDDWITGNTIYIHR